MKKFLTMIVLLSVNIISQDITELYDLSMKYYNEGNYELAIQYGEQLLQTWEKSYGEGDSPGFALIKNNLAFLYNLGKKYDEAEIMYNDALLMRRRLYLSPHHELAISISNLAGFYYDRGRTDLAHPLYVEALEMYRVLYNGDTKELATCINNVALFFISCSEFSKAETLFNESIGMHRRLYKTDHEALALSLNNAGYFYSNVGRFDEAETLYNEALAMRRRLLKDTHPDLCVSINNLAALYSELNKFEKAESLYSEVLSIRRRVHKSNHPDLARSLNNVSALFVKSGKYIEAEPLLLEALLMTRILYKSDHPDLAMSLNNFGYYYKALGRFSEAEQFYVDALAMRRRLFKFDNIHLAQSINNLALFYNSLGRISEAEELYIEAFEMTQRLYKFDHPELARGLNNLAVFYDKQQKTNDAEKFYINALQMYRRLYKTNHADLARILNNIALFYSSHEKLTESDTLILEAYQMYLKIYGQDHPDLAMVLLNVGYIYSKQLKYDEANQYYVEAVEMYKRLFNALHPNLALSIDNLAMLNFETGNYSEAEPLFIEALSIYKKMLNNYRASLSEKELNQFLKTFNYNFEFFNSFTYAYTTKTTTIQKANNSLLTKGLMLNQSRNVLSAVHQSGDTILSKKYEEWQRERSYLSRLFTKTKMELEQMGVDIDSLEKKVNAIEKELSKGSDLLGNIFTQNEKTWEDIRNKLQTGEAAIDITRFRYYDKVWTDSVFYSFTIITHETDLPKVIHLTNGKEMEEKLFLKYRYNIKQVGNIDSEDLIDTSYNIYWLPLNAELKGIKKIYLSLDGVYNKISLPSLKNNETGKYLFEEYQIVIVNNLGDILDQKIDKSKNRTAELFGYPNYDLTKEELQIFASNYMPNQRDLSLDDFTRSGLERFNVSILPGTKEEIEKIDSLLEKEKWSVKKYLWNDALEEAVKSMEQSPRTLMISTHGFFLQDPEREKEEHRIMGMNETKVFENPLLRSGLLLTGASTFLNLKNEKGYDKIDNGILTAYEASQLNLLNTELVVLSACETGLGEVQNGEGVFGLQRAFIIAGADAVLMSLWKVNDTATKDFMIIFFESWLENNDKQLALKTARDAIKAKYKFPYFWGAFVLVGE